MGEKKITDIIIPNEKNAAISLILAGNCECIWVTSVVLKIITF